MTTAASRLCCPHLGLQSDRTIMLMGPTMAHRCYVQPEALLPDPERQRQFCLGANHTQCPLYMPPPPTPLEKADNGQQAGTFAPTLATAPTPSTQLVLMQQPPIRHPKANRILLPRHHPAPLVHVKPRQPLLLPAVSSYSARQIHRWSFLSTKITLSATLALIVLTLSSSLFIRRQATGDHSYQAGGVVAQENQPSPTVTKPPLTAAVAVLQAAVNPSPTATATPTSLISLARLVTPTPPADGQVYTLTPGNNSVGWWMSNDSRRNHVNDAFLYVGQRGGESYMAALWFDLRQVPRGAEIVQGELRLTGIRADNFNATALATWQIQLIAEEALPNPASADFLTLLSAPAALTLSPTLTAGALAVGSTNTWQFEATVNRWLQEQLLQGATAVTMRITANTNGADTLFAWDSGRGATMAGTEPLLFLSIGPAPATPPLLPTKPFLVATNTRVPDNVVTVVALNNTATAVALTTGTYTPMPYQVVTPTPFPVNLATVQAIALDRGLPPVLLHTPTPGSLAQATGDAQYATAVALTTGTFTPVPTDFVTPVLIMPSPPAENIATEAARSVEATAIATSGTDTPTALPYNAVIAQYIYATPSPQNEVTAAAQSVIATADALVNGTPTPLPWNAVVITAVPTLLPPLPTALPSLQPVSDFTPTATPTVYVMPADMPAIYRNKILFKTNRSGVEETYALEPNSGELFRVNEPWVHTLAFQQIALAPDRSNAAVVMPDGSGVLQIQIQSRQYGTIRQVTATKGMSYDPAWSPQGDKIAFVGTDSGSDEIYLVSVDGSVVQQLTANNNLWDKHPSWSPDGTQIVFFSNREGSRRQLWIMNADGSNQRNLSNNSYEDWDPIWVP